MGEIKTAAEIAAEAMGAFTVTGGDVEECSVEFIREQIIAAVEEDRKQRDLYELIAEALDERAELDEDAGEGYSYRARAVAAIRAGEGDELWDRHIGPMLDDIEAEFYA